MSRRAFYAPQAQLLAPGEARRGDMVLVRHSGVVSAAIRGAEHLRRPRGVSQAVWDACCRYNHCAWLVADGCVVQEAARGAVRTPLAALVAQAEAVLVVRWQATQAQLDAAVAFELSTVGTGYGYAQIVADAFNAATGLELGLGWGDRMVCSTSCCRAAERLGLIPDRSPSAVTPAHLAFYAGVGQ